MADLEEFKVLRRHEGDRMYEEGEIREGARADLNHLIPNVLQPIAKQRVSKAPPAEKAEPAPQNKAEPAPANKAESSAVNKTSDQARHGRNR